MREEIEARCLEIGQYIAEHGATVRAAARRFGVSKSSVHKDMHERLPELSQTLARGRNSPSGLFSFLQKERVMTDGWRQ